MSFSKKRNIQKSRRKLLAAMSVGAAAKLPDLWTKPTVASVMLPAHAAGSPDPDPAPNCECAITYVRAGAFSVTDTYGINLLAGASLNCTTLGGGQSCSFIHSVGGTVQTAAGIYLGYGTCSLTQPLFVPSGACYTASNAGQSIVVNFYDASGVICSDTQAIDFSCLTTM